MPSRYKAAGDVNEPVGPAGVTAYPSTEELGRALAMVFGGNAPHAQHVRILRRRVNDRSSTSLTEVLTCGLQDGRQVDVFCKHEAGKSHSRHGHRGGVAYEAEVYRRVLDPLAAISPKLYGATVNPRTSQTSLFIEHLEGFDCCHRSPHPDTMVAVARWLGWFHQANRQRAARLPFLHRYSASYYAGWSHRALQFSESLHRSVPWLPAVCNGFVEATASLRIAPTVIHGEFYPLNILASGTTIKPIDWESCAVAAAEIDLAALTEGWPPELVSEVVAAYRAACGIEASSAFEKRLDLARLYWQFRWLGDNPDWTVDEAMLPRIATIERLATKWRVGMKPSPPTG